jgi:hypothetical protein
MTVASLKEFPGGKAHGGTPRNAILVRARGRSSPIFHSCVLGHVFKFLFNFDQFVESPSFILLYRSARFLCQQEPAIVILITQPSEPHRHESLRLRDEKGNRALQLARTNTFKEAPRCSFVVR